jgi:hypothetical protein
MVKSSQLSMTLFQEMSKDGSTGGSCFLLCAFPNFLGKSLSCCQMILSHGDSTEIHHINMAIQDFWTRMHQSQCVFHLVHLGWKRNIPSVWPGKSLTPLLKSLRLVKMVAQDWLVSFASATTYEEMEEACLLSKSFLFTILQSSNIHKLLGAVIQETISDFIRMGVEPYQANFVYYF